MSYQIPAGPKDYVPPPKPPSAEQRAWALRIGSVLITAGLVGACAYFLASGFSFANTVVTVGPLAAIAFVVIAGLARGMDTLTRWIGYLGMIVTGAGLVLAYATGR